MVEILTLPEFVAINLRRCHINFTIESTTINDGKPYAEIEYGFWKNCHDYNENNKAALSILPREINKHLMILLHQMFVDPICDPKNL